jgi:RNA polymerase sigma factor (sigma-70 family)
MEKVIKQVAYSVLRKLPHKAELDDLLQEGRLAVWLQRSKIAELSGKHADAFVSQCARWAMIDWVRRMWPARGKSGAILNTNVDDYEEWPDVVGADTTLSHAQAKQAVENLERVIEQNSNYRSQKLVATHRLQVLRGCIEGLDGTDIAKKLGIRPETVTAHRNAIRKFVCAFVG